uniref:Uncharacterized protein n=1 Tax=Anguilla anguilla TaxID=7936 RepID=A0A0E9QAQ6_ANGAN
MALEPIITLDTLVIALVLLLRFQIFQVLVTLRGTKIEHI